MTNNSNDFGDLLARAGRFNNPYAPVFIKNPETGKIVDVNKMALEMLKTSRKDLLEKDFESVINTYFEDSPYKKLKQDERLFSVDHTKIDRSGVELDQVTLIPVIVTHNEDTKAILQKMAEVLIHRLRSPLTGMMGFADLIDENADEKTRRYIGKIKNGLNDVAGSLSRIEKLSREFEVQKSPFKTDNLMVDLLNEFTPEERKHIKIIITENEMIETDYVLVKAILYELVKNGLEHNPKGHVRIYSPSKGIFRVVSHGKVIDPDIVSKIFYPFYSLKARSIGLGLTISKLQADAMGACLQLVQNSEEGIVFELSV